MSDNYLFGQEMRENGPVQEAMEMYRRGYEAQMHGRLDEAIKLYSQSIEIWPTAEAYTFRGWAKSFRGWIDQAIEDCQKAIEVDPDYGNPYNDIGAYLIEKGDLGGAIPWLKRALSSKRYECYFYPHFNLGRIYEKKGDMIRAMNCFKAAYDVNNNYVQALKAFRRLQAKLN